MPQTVHHLPLAEIDAASLTRDRTAIDLEALLELRQSILRSGLRMPIEVYAFPEARGDHRYGLLSGFRRLASFRELRDIGLDDYATIPAFLRTPADRAEALAAMVEENAVRADISPWEQAQVAVRAADQGIFDTLEAVDHLFPHANTMKRSRIRAVGRVVDLLEYILKEPERLSLRQLLRISNAIRKGFAEPLEVAARQTSLRDLDDQWAAMLPYLIESERFSTPEEPEPTTRAPATRGRARRVLKPRPHLVIRREISRDGYLLRFTGKEATSSLLDEVLDEIERWFSPAEPRSRP
jgi:ParB family chromosome partitioning protein